MEINTYKDAVFAVKRGFHIIGLTGYTGSGCSTFSNLLSKKNKPKLPDYDAIKGFDTSEGKSKRDKRIYDKLVRHWNQLKWEPFVPIEILTVIFAFVIQRVQEKTKCDSSLLEIKQFIKGKEKRLQYLTYILSTKKISKNQNDKIIDSYNLCKSLYSEFKQKKRKENKFDELITLMQNYGDEIRKYGKVCPTERTSISPKNLFVLPEAIRRIIKSFREKDYSYFAIDSFRNPFEIEFFKWRYSEFYLVAILREKEDRHKGLNLLGDSLKELDKRESGERFQRSSENIESWVVSQDIKQCLNKADVYIENQTDSTSTYPHLRFSLIKVITLAKYPGCVPPTRDERSMQVAMTARQISGCISRKVGAVVVNKGGYIIGIGWNDPPRGQTPCSLRTGKDLVDSPDKTVFSEYELSSDFVSHIRTNCYTKNPFCFRSELPIVLNEQNGAKREFTRALHAEENALFQANQISGSTLSGATLYTTDSPCTLCAKKIYQLGIERIVYIEDYPGIAIKQTINAGDRKITVSRFQGIIGSAYFRLYNSLLSEKDLIQLYIKT